MIFNRTQNDVNDAIKIRNEKIQTFQLLTESDIAILEKGTMTIDTLNRIEDKQKLLKELFNEMGYWNTPTENKTWDYSQIFDEAEFQRIIDNTNVLRDAFFVYKDTPNTPPISYHYEDINALEKILYDLGEMVKDVEDHYRECNDFECGEEQS